VATRLPAKVPPRNVLLSDMKELLSLKESYTNIREEYERNLKSFLKRLLDK
jgi:hypothetical protein